MDQARSDSVPAAHERFLAPTRRTVAHSEPDRGVPRLPRGRAVDPPSCVRASWTVAGVGLVAVALIALLGSSIPSSFSHGATALAAPQAATARSLVGSGLGPLSDVPGLTLGINANPRAICPYGSTLCGAGIGETQVTLNAQASPNGIQSWPKVQVAFVIETTAYDGAYDEYAGDPGSDVCASSSPYICEESTGLCFFVMHASQIAAAIQAANPHTEVSFALVDYFATLDNFDDGDGAEYHVDIPQFVVAADFGPAVAASLQANQLQGGCAYSDSDLSDNTLHSSSITALYGTIIGSGLGWAQSKHHEVVWMGSTCSRDPSCSVDYSVSSSGYGGSGGSSMSPTCEPSYDYGGTSSPNCEGWTRAQDGNPNDSIAALARTSPSCTGSIGHVCTIDMIDLYDGVTDPWSKAWPTGVPGGGPGGRIVEQNVAKILLAGCGLAAATGGTWNGPDFFACPNGRQGTLAPSFLTPNSTATISISNPSLFAALRLVGFGPIETTLIANGTNRPMFSFVPFGAVAPAPEALGGPQWKTVCTLQNGLAWQGNGSGGERCPSSPSSFTASGLTYYGWNWSDNASENAMYIGEAWTLTFFAVVNGPPFRTVPVDACTTSACGMAGSRAIDGVFTSANYLPVTNLTPVTESFPVATLLVEANPSAPPPPSAPLPPPLAPPSIPVAVPPGIPVIAPIGISAQVGVGNVALQATAAGFLAAGFIRVQVRNRPLAMSMATMNGKNRPSQFDGTGAPSDASVGRFE